jgi:photosynthetic reaction center cytochrome c subunit
MSSLFPRAVKVYFGIFVFSLVCLPAVDAQGPPPSMEGKTAGEYYKNIKVLKEIPASEVLPTMQFIRASLGVECDFCHVEREFDKDDKKPKEIARKMIQMQFAINKNNFDGEREVTCNSCHRGATHPEAVPAVALARAQPANPEQHEPEIDKSKWPSGAAVLAKYLEAVGGKSALDKISARVEKGSALMPGGHDVPVDIYSKPPEIRVSVMHMQGGDSVTALSGKEGWLASPNRPAREMSASDRRGAQLDAAAFYPQQLVQMFSDSKLQPQPEKVGDQPASVVVATVKGEPPVKLYFATNTGLLVRMVHYGDSVLGLNPVQVDFGDYREAGGVKTPYRWTIARPSGAFTIQVSDVQTNVPIDEKLLVKPAGTPAPPH